MLSFLPGTVANWPWPQAMLSDDGPRQVGAWLRDYRTAVGSFAPPKGAVWRDRSSGLAPGQLVLHGDPGPWNAVWSGGELQGFIDWDLAHPGDPTEEVLEALWHVVPLYDDGACREAGFREGCDRMHRTAVFLEAYRSGLRFSDERSAAEAVLAHARRQREQTLRLSAKGVEPWVTLSKRWPELHLKWLWLEEQANQEPARVLIQDYDPSWPALFEQVQRYVESAFVGITVEIEHVGSTAVPGLAAKPVIDVDVVVPSPSEVGAAITQLGSVGYKHQGDLGVSGREAFESPPGLPEHHLYLVVQGTRPHLNHILFRDYMRRHPDALARYGELKKSLAAAYGRDREGYTKAKSEFIDEVLREASGCG